jgi:hypothetical protein
MVNDVLVISVILIVMLIVFTLIGIWIKGIKEE